MATPQFVPVDPNERPRSYESPGFVPTQWITDRPGSFTGRQPTGARLGVPGPGQGYALRLAARLAPHVVVEPGESVDDAVTGCLGIALRRAALHARAPVIHDLTLALTIWGFLDTNPPIELVALRRSAFAGVRQTLHHYTEARAIADGVPESTLRLSADEAKAAYPQQWKTLLGVM